MKKYKVVVTMYAKADLRRYPSYLRNKKNHAQAAWNVLEDFITTKESLCSIGEA